MKHSFSFLKIIKTNLQVLIAILLSMTCSMLLCAQQDTIQLKNTLPKSGQIVNDKPVGNGWANLLSSTDDWTFEDTYWKLSNNIMHGEIGNEKEHHYGYTKKTYNDFELNVLIKMVGDDDANSGICVRINPTSFDDAPGYQIDMGKGYWGSLWEERRGNMVQKYPDSQVAKIVNKNEWNHFYIIAKGHHIEAWLNGVKTIDIVHEDGFTEGNIGFQLCHMHNPTVVDIKSLYIREIK